jgi:hypothetical protein
MSENEKVRVSRRKFLEDSSKTALVGTAAAFLGFGLKPAKAKANVTWCVFGCSGGCSGACTSCSGGCGGGCSGGCQGGCEGGCSGSCSGGCTGTSTAVASSVHAQTSCGTPVLQQEVSNRHVVA